MKFALHGRNHRPGGADPLDWAPYDVKIVSDGDNLSVADGQWIFMVPRDCHNLALTEVAIYVTTPSSAGLPAVQLRNVVTGHDMLSTMVTIDVGQFDSYDAFTQAVIDPLYAVVSAKDRISIDVKVAGTGAKGLGVILRFG